VFLLIHSIRCTFFLQAKVALEAGFRRGNARERLGNGKVNKRREQAKDCSDHLRLVFV